MTVDVIEQCGGRRAILYGVGADIGINLLIQNDPLRDGFAIDTAVTRPLEVGGSIADNLEHVLAKAVLARPDLSNLFAIDASQSALEVGGRRVRIVFGEADHHEPDGVYDLAIVATSRRDINNADLMHRWAATATYVLGVAENPSLPAVYAGLADTTVGSAVANLTAVPRLPPGAYALGSCQCVGWSVQLAAVGVVAHDIGGRVVRSEIDLVHPDTASSTFGTRGIGARLEDARDNLRPGRSQVAISMQRFTRMETDHGVSLRTLVQPPGYQICRFYLDVAGAAITPAVIADSAQKISADKPGHIAVTTEKWGSRAYAFRETACTLLGDNVAVERDFLGSGLTRITLQAFIHNTIGYCQSVLSTAASVVAQQEINQVDPQDTHDLTA